MKSDEITEELPVINEGEDIPDEVLKEFQKSHGNDLTIEQDGEQDGEKW